MRFLVCAMALSASILTGCGPSTWAGQAQLYIDSPKPLPPQPSRVRSEAKRGKVKLPQQLPDECKALPKEEQNGCWARIIIVLLKNSENDKHNALVGATSFHDKLLKQYNGKRAK